MYLIQKQKKILKRICNCVRIKGKHIISNQGCKLTKCSQLSLQWSRYTLSVVVARLAVWFGVQCQCFPYAILLKHIMRLCKKILNICVCTYQIVCLHVNLINIGVNELPVSCKLMINVQYC